MKPGGIYTTRTLRHGSFEAKLNPKYVHQVLLLETTENKFDFTGVHATDCLNGIGWCRYDDITECLGEEAANKVLAYTEKKLLKQIKEAGIAT